MIISIVDLFYLYIIILYVFIQVKYLNARQVTSLTTVTHPARAKNIFTRTTYGPKGALTVLL